MRRVELPKEGKCFAQIDCESNGSVVPMSFGSAGKRSESESETGDAVLILGVRIHTLPVEDLLSTVEHTVLRGDRAIIANVNVHAMNLAYDLPWFRQFLNQSKVVFCDGFGVKWGARFLGYRMPYRYTPPDWIDRLAETTCRNDFSLFFLGARPGVAERAAARLRERFPSLRVVGTHHGYFDKTPGGSENEAIIKKINAVKPNILIVGFGMPLQERWLMVNWSRIQVNVALPGGAVFDYVSGELRRAPRWMTDHGLEWLGRLLIEPRRLWRRYLVGNPLFFWRVLKQRLGREDWNKANPSR
jgi:N-acetylglucosaminyldiphosphoundecaprenol N-acetyl-beta-D-mannosaminyltransferase